MSHATTLRSRRTPLVLLLLAVVAVLAGCTSSGASEPEAGGVQTLEVDGRERSYVLEPAKGLQEGEKIGRAHV